VDKLRAQIGAAMRTLESKPSEALPSVEQIAAARREQEAHERRYKHGKAARTWEAVALESPERAASSKILARWMAAYEAADAEAEKAFSELAAVR
jgi:hypothetical protein